MAIACDQCQRPVHEQTVVCPHCGGPSGVPRDPIALAEVSVMLELEGVPEPVPLPYLLSNQELDDELPEPGPPKPRKPSETPSTNLPRAIARRRSRD